MELILSSLTHFDAGGDEKKDKEIVPVIQECYEKFFVNTENWSRADFYHAVCLTVEYSKFFYFSLIFYFFSNVSNAIYIYTHTHTYMFQLLHATTHTKMRHAVIDIFF